MGARQGVRAYPRTRSNALSEPFHVAIGIGCKSHVRVHAASRPVGRNVARLRQGILARRDALRPAARPLGLLPPTGRPAATPAENGRMGRNGHHRADRNARSGQGGPRRPAADHRARPEPVAALADKSALTTFRSLPRLPRGGPNGRRAPHGTRISPVCLRWRVGRRSMVGPARRRFHGANRLRRPLLHPFPHAQNCSGSPVGARTGHPRPMAPVAATAAGRSRLR